MLSKDERLSQDGLLRGEKLLGLVLGPPPPLIRRYVFGVEGEALRGDMEALVLIAEVVVVDRCIQRLLDSVHFCGQSCLLAY
mgnify:CR=1 FL=1